MCMTMGRKVTSRVTDCESARSWWTIRSLAYVIAFTMSLTHRYLPCSDALRVFLRTKMGNARVTDQSARSC